MSSRYEIPISPWDTTLAIHAQATWSKVVEKPFDDLGIKSRTRTYGVSVTQPIHRSRNATVYAFATGEYRESRSYLLGQRFSFLLGPVDGLAKEAVLRFGGDAFYSSRLQAVAARSMFSLGIDALGATKHAGDTPDGQFFAWLGQLQWARRFPSLGDLSLIARGDVQLSDRPLLGLEQFAIGGRDTVRGYRENLLVRDNGLVGGLEVRVPIPLPRWREFDPHLELAPFVDAGYSWNDDSPNAGPTTLVSVGVGGRLDLSHGFGFQIYWGHPLKKVARIGNRSLQDDGVHMEGSWSW